LRDVFSQFRVFIVENVRSLALHCPDEDESCFLELVGFDAPKPLLPIPDASSRICEM
jgi:hypothetical protein